MTLTQYLDTALLRVNLEIDETVSPDKVIEYVTEANQQLDVELKPYAPKIPFESNDIKFGQIRKCALHYARKLWFSFILEYDIAEEEEKQYMAKLDGLKASFIADRNVRTIAVAVVEDPLTRKVYQPVQRDSFLDVFT